MSHIEEIPCIEVLSSVVFIIEGVVEESQNPQAIASHLNTCLACQAEVIMNKRCICCYKMRYVAHVMKELLKTYTAAFMKSYCAK